MSCSCACRRPAVPPIAASCRQPLQLGIRPAATVCKRCSANKRLLPKETGRPAKGLGSFNSSVRKPFQLQHLHPLADSCCRPYARPDEHEHEHDQDHHASNQRHGKLSHAHEHDHEHEGDSHEHGHTHAAVNGSPVHRGLRWIFRRTGLLQAADHLRDNTAVSAAISIFMGLAALATWQVGATGESCSLFLSHTLPPHWRADQ